MLTLCDSTRQRLNIRRKYWLVYTVLVLSDRIVIFSTAMMKLGWESFYRIGVRCCATIRLGLLKSKTTHKDASERSIAVYIREGQTLFPDSTLPLACSDPLDWSLTFQTVDTSMVFIQCTGHWRVLYISCIQAHDRANISTLVFWLK